MKKLLIFAVCLMAFAACKNEKTGAGDASQADSLQRVIDQKDDEINDMMGTLNDIQEGFRQINEAEGKVELMQSGEGTNKAQQLRESVQFIAERMEQNRQLIEKLRQQLRESSFKGDQLKKTIDNLTRQIQEKDQELQRLRAELDAKDIHISELDETINNLNSDVSSLKSETEQKTETINTQDRQLNTAWYVFGTSSELKEQGILVKGKVLQGNFNKEYFTKVDIRVMKELKLYSKSAELLTSHPASSYTLTRDANKQYILHITNPVTFWSTSKYLVIQVK